MERTGLTCPERLAVVWLITSRFLVLERYSRLAEVLWRYWIISGFVGREEMGSKEEGERKTYENSWYWTFREACSSDDGVGQTIRRECLIY